MPIGTHGSTVKAYGRGSKLWKISNGSVTQRDKRARLFFDDEQPDSTENASSRRIELILGKTRDAFSVNLLRLLETYIAP